MNFWELLAGLGIFLFGIMLMEESIKNLSGRAFKNFIRRYTSTTPRAVLSGTLSTAILQSSSAITLMVLAFVGAGIMSLQSAIGVILGSNIGTTLTSWIVATLGFKLQIEALAFPLIGVGGLILIFLGRSDRWINLSKLLVGFGLLFMGIDFLKSGFGALSGQVDLDQLPQWGWPLYLGIGFLLTVLVQSSSAAMAIILSGVFSGAIDFSNAMVMVIGINLGTTVTAAIGSIGGSPDKRRVALSHFLFNFITAVLALLLLYPLSILIQEWMNLKADPVMGLAVFHTLFNIIGVLVFLPFINLLARMLPRIIKEDKTSVTLYIHKLSVQVPEAAIEALLNEAKHLLQRCVRYNLQMAGISSKRILQTIAPDVAGKIKIELQFAQINELQAELFLFAAHIQKEPLSMPESAHLNKIMNAVRSITASSKLLNEVEDELSSLSDAENTLVLELVESFKLKTQAFYQQLMELFYQENEPKRITKLHNLWNSVRDDDQNFIQQITQAIQKASLQDEEISGLLSINRSFVLSAKQAIMALRDLVLKEEEAKLITELSDMES